MKTDKISSNTVIMYFALGYKGQYIFKDEIKLSCIHVKNQAVTGTRGTLPTTSFNETGILKMSKEIALLQMMNVRIMYLKTAQHYVMRQLEDRPDRCGLISGTLQVMRNSEIIPQAAYPVHTAEEDSLDLWELDSVLKTFLNEVINVSHPGDQWNNAL